MKKVKHFYEDCVGWFDFQKTYDKAVKESKDGDILVETGTANGKSIAYLSVESRNAGKDLKIFTIDNTTDQAQLAWIDTILPKMPNVTYLHEDSLGAANKFKDGSCRMVYLDADHSYDFVSKELRAWWPKVMKGGMYCGHDWSNSFPGLVKAVIEFAREYALTVEDHGNTWFIRK